MRSTQTPARTAQIGSPTAPDLVSAPHARGGFTLIELLMVIVIVGLLVAIAAPKFGSAKEKAYISRMTNDLRNLIVGEESYFNDYQTYYAGSVPGTGLIFGASNGVTVVINSASNAGWAATATSIGTARQCKIFTGPFGPNGPATVEGKVACTP